MRAWPSARASTPPPRSCLVAIDRLARQRRFVRVLDVGCGSGVLAIAAAKCWPAAVLAVDNDPIAVRVARSNAELNGVGRRVGPSLPMAMRHPIDPSPAPLRPDPGQHPGRSADRARAGAAAHIWRRAAGPSCPGCWTARPRRWLRRIGARACGCSAMLSRALGWRWCWAYLLGIAGASEACATTSLLRGSSALAIDPRLSSPRRAGGGFWSFPSHAEDEVQAERRQAFLVHRHRQGEARGPPITAT